MKQKWHPSKSKNGLREQGEKTGLAQCCIFWDIKWVIWSLSGTFELWRGKEYLPEAFCCGLTLCRGVCNFDLCFRCLQNQRLPEFFTPEQRPWAGNGCCLWPHQMKRSWAMAWESVDGAVGQSTQCREDCTVELTLEPYPIIRNILVKDWKAAAFQQTPSIWW